MVLDEIIIAITGIAAGIVTAIVTVWREHIKDIKERYEERADLYKKDHFRKLEYIIKNEIDREKKIIEGSENGTSKGIEAIQTPGVKITYNYNKVKVDTGLQFIEDDNLLSHIKSGYKELYARMEKAEKHEEDYINLINETINPIMEELHEIEGDITILRDAENIYTSVLPVKNVKTLPNNYYKSNIINYIIDDYDFLGDSQITNDGIMVDDEERLILTFYNGKLDKIDIDRFLNICTQIKNEHLEEIKKIETMNTQIDEIYKDIHDKLKGIADDLNAGQTLEGTCKICRKIDEGKERQSLMPFIRF